MHSIVKMMLLPQKSYLRGKTCMKKTFVMTLAVCSLLSANSLASCSSSKDTIRLQLTASREGVDLSANAAALQPILEKYDTKHKYVVSVGTSFAADGTALAAGTIDAAFITASTFATTEIAQPGKVDMVLRASRSSFKVIEENPDPSDSTNHTNEAARAAQIVKMNDTSYYHGEAGQGVASYYYAVCLINRNNLSKFDTDGDGKVELYELAGKKIALQSTTSPAGYSYPLYAFHNETNGGKWADGMKKVDSNADASKGEFVAVSAGGYGTAFKALMDNDGTVDALWGYMDLRNDQAKNYTDKNVFDSTYTVALTQGILNDGVAVRHSLEDEKKKAITDVFKKIMTEGGSPFDNGKNSEDKKAENNNCYDVNNDGQASDAYAVYSLYSHTGYVDATNSDYNEEIEFQKWASKNLTSK